MHDRTRPKPDAISETYGYTSQMLVCFFFLFSPVNFLGGLSNRYTIAVTFGATANKCAILLISAAVALGGPEWLKSKFLALRNFLFCLFACLHNNR